MQVILNSYWGVPTSIVRNEMLPRLKKNPAYLENNDMEVYSEKVVGLLVMVVSESKFQDCLLIIYRKIMKHEQKTELMKP